MPSPIKEFARRNAGRFFIQFEDGGDILPLGNAVTIAPFIETGTLRPSIRADGRPMRLPKVPLKIELTARLDTSQFEAGINRFLMNLEKMQRAKIRRLWPRRAALFTLFVAVVAICL